MMTKAGKLLESLGAEACVEVSPDKRPLVDLSDSANTSTDSDVTSTDPSQSEASSPSAPTPPRSEEPSGGADRDSDSDTEYEKPPHSYIALISMALLAAPERKCLLGDIYQYIMDKHPFYRYTPDKAWRNSIRHNLSLNECFIKNGRADNGKGNFWAIHPACEEDFAKGDFRRRQARRRARRSQQAQASHARRHDFSYVPMTSVPAGYELPSAEQVRNYGRPHYHPYASVPTYYKENANVVATTSSSPPLPKVPVSYSNLTNTYSPQGSYHFAQNGYGTSSPSNLYTSPASYATYSLTLTGSLHTPFHPSPFPLSSSPYMPSESTASHSTSYPATPTNTQGSMDTLSPVPYSGASPTSYNYPSSSDVSTSTSPGQSHDSGYLGYVSSDGTALHGIRDIQALRDALGSLASLSN